MRSFCNSPARRATILLFALLLLLQAPAPPAHAREAFAILLSDDMRDVEPLLRAYGKDRYDLTFAYEGISDVITLLEGSECPYDAVWLSSTVWLEMKEGGQRISGSKITSITPVVFAMTEAKAEALGFAGKDALPLSAIVEAVREKALRFVLPSVTQTNTGASIYLSLLSALAGSPELLRTEDLDQPALLEDLAALFSGVERSAGSDAFVLDLAASGEYDCIVGAESGVIALNQRLEAEGKPPFVLLYPADGVSLADAPFAYIDRGDAQKRAAFLDLQTYILSPEGQDGLARLGRRTGYGGLISPAYEDIFRPAWGVRTDEYLYPIHYPSKSVIQQAFALYQSVLRKPSVTAFCLDFSGSMAARSGRYTGHQQLIQALSYILSPEEASREYIQFTSRDIVIAYGFTSMISNRYGAYPGDETLALLAEIEQSTPFGGTNIYLPVAAAIQALEQYDPDAYTRSIVLMTDGMSEGDISSLTPYYQEGSRIPVYSILFGDAYPEQLDRIAALTGGMVFDGRSGDGGGDNLMKAFRTIRGYN